MAALEFDMTTIGRFSSVLRYNVETYLDLYRIFIRTNYPLIYNYFTKPKFAPDAASFDFLNAMTQESDKLNALLNIHSDSFSKVDDWNLLDFIEDVRIKLQTINNLSKWTRSTSTQNSWNATSVQSNIQLKRNQTIEDITLSILNDNNNQNDWSELAIENNLTEGDYSIRGGATLEITQPLGSSPNLFLRSIVDNLSGDKLYGLDFNNKINWVNNDLAVLSYIDTVKQSVNTLITLRKGDVPEFFDFGVDINLLTGLDLGSLSYVSIIRQLGNVFASDDSLRNFNITQFSYKDSVSNVSFSIDTMHDVTYKNTLPLIAN